MSVAIRFVRNARHGVMPVQMIPTTRATTALKMGVGDPEIGLLQISGISCNGQVRSDVNKIEYAMPGNAT